MKLRLKRRWHFGELPSKKLRRSSHAIRQRGRSATIGRDEGKQMKIGDYFVQGRRPWVRLHEKGGKEHDVPCHHRLEQYLHDYLEAAGIGDDVDSYLFRSARRKTGQLTSNPLFQQDAYRSIRRRAKAAGIETRIGNHSFRATGITAYLKNGDKLEVAQDAYSLSKSLRNSSFARSKMRLRLAERFLPARLM